MFRSEIVEYLVNMKLLILFGLILVAFNEVTFGYIRHYGPMYPSTRGEALDEFFFQEIRRVNLTFQAEFGRKQRNKN